MATVQELADRVLAGRLEDNIRAWRDDGMSFDDMARRLAPMGVDVSGEVVRRWAKGYGIDTSRLAAT